MLATDPRSRLLADRREVESAIGTVESQLDALQRSQQDVAADDEHDPEGPTASLQRAELVAMLRQSRRHLDDVDAALRRVDDGSYGVCANCGRDIPPARLEARPFADNCVACATLKEKR